MVAGRSLALPVDRSRSAIADAVFENRVTLVLGSTACGKSSRVPQLLLEDVGGPVLCTQPRRLAVVSIAKRVAEERGVALGGDEGSFYSYTSGVYQASQCTINHAMVLVGYNKTAGVGSPDLYWIIRNSWGTWGDKGYIKVQMTAYTLGPCAMYRWARALPLTTANAGGPASPSPPPSPVPSPSPPRPPPPPRPPAPTPFPRRPPPPCLTKGGSGKCRN